MSRVADLAGADLDAWVARALGWQLFYMEPGQLWLTLFEKPGGGEGPIGSIESGAEIFDDFKPSTKWQDGGPLIEKYRIDLGAPTESGTFAGIWMANTEWGHINGWQGPTPLIAAMRALVASVYGDTVPDEVEA